MKRIVLLFPLLMLLFLPACSPAPTGKDYDEAAIKQDIVDVMSASEAGWNSGDLEQYMQSYVKSDSLRFGGNGSVTYGWAPVLERYKKKYTDKAAMGTLTFSDIDITVISKDAALVFGKWELDKENEHPHGLFTLLFRKTPDGWRIVHDHSSSARED
jgi:ketosteroid isomerase-like protein